MLNLAVFHNISCFQIDLTKGKNRREYKPIFFSEPFPIADVSKTEALVIIFQRTAS